MNPIRTCMGCNKKENKDDFIRIVKYNNKIFNEIYENLRRVIVNGKN